MDIITKVRTAKNKLTIMGGFALICSMGYIGYSTYPLFLFVTLIIFADMVEEDAKYMTVDIRKTAVLGLFFLLASKEPIGNFLYTVLIALLAFRIIYLIAIFRYSKERTTVEVVGEEKRFNNPIGFLPSFGLGFLSLALYLEIVQQSKPLFLSDFEIFLTEVGSIISSVPFFWIVLLISWIALELGFRWYKKQDIEIVEGLGLGDVIVFPFFAAFLGITTFLFVLFLGCIIHICQYFLGYIYKD